MLPGFENYDEQVKYWMDVKLLISAKNFNGFSGLNFNERIVYIYYEQQRYKAAMVYLKKDIVLDSSF